MGPLKAPGADGIHALFYQSQWEIVGPSIHELVCRTLAGGPLQQQLCTTLIALIPKVPSPETFSKFRPPLLGDV